MTAKELKASILQLAVTGKLVPQDPNDEPASVLLERIKAEKSKLIKAGKIKKDKNPSEIVTGSDGAVYEKFKDGTVKDISDELPFEIPATWRWVRFSDVTLNRDAERIPLSKDQRSHLAKNFDYYGASGVIDKVDKYLFDKPLLLVGEDGANLLARSTPIAFIASGKYWVNNHAHVIDAIEFDLLKYLETFINAIPLTPYITGTAQPKMNQEKMNGIVVALPPLAEQKRIVAKIEKLMPLVEEYGKLEEMRLQLDADLPSALEKSILQEAIQGKLVPQDPNDEPASELLKRIAAERKALVKVGKLKRDKTESVIFRGSDRLAYETRNGKTVCIQGETPFDIPDSWEWVRLGDLSNYGQCKSVDTADIDPGTWSLDLEEIEKGTGRLIERKTAADKRSKSSKHVFTKGTLLYSKLRTYLNKVLVADMDGVCTSEIVPIELNGGVNAEYVRLVLMSPYFLEYTASKGYGIKMPRVGTDDMKQSLIPLPPLDEQKRIVKRVEELKGTARTLVTF